MPAPAREVVLRFYEQMATNDFRAAAESLHEDYLLEWPQSGERIRGRDNFIAVNEHYPASGRWSFRVDRAVAEGDQVVTQVGVSDGVIRATAIAFTRVRDGKIASQIEFWPEPFEPAGWRRAWVEQAEASEKSS